MDCYPNVLELVVYTSLGAGGGPVAVNGNVTCGDGAFHHYAVCFAGGQAELYFDGSVVGAAAAVPANKSAPFHIGSWISYPTLATTTVDEVRISAGHRYTAAFTPAKRLTADANTLHLYHLDEGTGSTTVDSASGGTSLTLPAGVTWASTCP